MSLLSLVAFNSLLWCAAATDLRSFRIPNALPLLVALAGLALHLPAGPGELLDRGVAMLVIGAVGGWLWLRGLFGGGDYKLLWACAVWVGWEGLAPFILAFGLASGAQGLAVLAMARRGAGEAGLRSRLRGRVPLALSIAAAGMYWSLLQFPGARLAL